MKLERETTKKKKKYVTHSGLNILITVKKMAFLEGVRVSNKLYKKTFIRIFFFLVLDEYRN